MPKSRRGPEAASVSADDAAAGVRVLKKYPNRRLYDTQSSSYITLSDVKKMVLGNEAFEVRDARTGEDLTRSILLQIILEEETGGVPIFSTPMLAQLIRFYGHAMQGLMGSYLEKNLQNFIELQTRMAQAGGSSGLYDPAKFSPEAWTQFLGGQSPFAQNFMSSYLDQSNSLVTQMQEQMAKNANALFPGMPGFSTKASKS